MNYKFYFKILFLAFITLHCASTNLTSFKDPDYPNANFKRILIVVNTGDLENRLRLESKMVEAFRGTEIFALESFKLFPPTREINNEDKTKLLLENNIDSFISISVGESGVDEVYIPPTSSTTKTEGNVNVYGNKASYEEKSKTTYQGGYTLSKPWAGFETKLFDVSNGRMVWIASSFTGGNALANFNTVINSYCKEVVKRLEDEELILTKKIKDKRISEQKKIEEKKKAKELKGLIKEKYIPQEKSIIYLKDGSIIKGLIIITEREEGKIVNITIRDNEGKIVTVNLDAIEKIETIK